MKRTESLVYNGSFWEAICPIIFSSQILGILPLKVIRTYSSDSIKFSWISKGSIIFYSLIAWMLFFMGTLVHRNQLFDVEILTFYMFLLMGFLIYSAFFQMARKWSEIVKVWTEKEQRFLLPEYATACSKKLRYKLRFTATLIAVLSIGEHSLCWIHDIYIWHRRTIDCNLTNRGPIRFFKERFPSVDAITPNIFALGISQVGIVLITAAWNFLDLFIILLSIGISSRFKQLTEALENYLKHTPRSKASFAASMLRFRLDFIDVCDLLAYVNNHMGALIFLSVSNNLFFICSHLLNAFNPLRFFTDHIYYWASLSYLIGRTLFLFLSAASIHEKSKGPKALLYDIPAEYWNSECERILYNINTSEIGLSVKGLCLLTRNVILQMAGSIVTFELLMLQYIAHPFGELPPFCD